MRTHSLSTSVLLGVSLLCGGLAGPSARADATDRIAGSIIGEIDGNRVVLASLENEYTVDVTGDIANVRLQQRFENPYDKAMNARYLFPLNSAAAVHAMTMRVGDEVIQAEVQEVQKAQQTFAKAQKAGKAAALLTQQRPNMFTQKVANLMPGVPIKVEIQYSHVVPKKDGEYELVVPLVVGPRFQPAGAGVPPGLADEPSSAGSDEHAPDGRDVSLAAATETGLWELEALPEYPPAAGVHLPSTIVGERVAMHVSLEAPMPLQRVYSDTHPIQGTAVSSTQQTITFAAGKVLDNKDFVLRYQLAGDKTSTGLLTHWEPEEGGYFSLLIEPPAEVSSGDIVPREMVFLLDCSGSMSGDPIAASKLFMSKALQALRPQDTFRIIRFSDQATEFSTQPVQATPANVAWGLEYTAKLSGYGGTVMTSGVEQALRRPPAAGMLRNVIFLTDGYIGNEVSVLRLVEGMLGDARLFAFGVGTGVNRYLLEELGRVGRGFTRYFDPTRPDEDMQSIATELATKLQTPVLTDIEIDWGTLDVGEVVPAALPDLYAGEALRVSGRYAEGAEGEVTISARGATQTARITQTVALSDHDERPAVRRLWARTAVAQRMHTFITPLERRPLNITNASLKREVTELGLAYGLTTRWTAFVAVSKRIVNAHPDQAANGTVALPKVSGTTKSAYGVPALTGSAMTGYGAPEPGIWLGLAAAGAGIAWSRRRRRARN